MLGGYISLDENMLACLVSGFTMNEWFTNKMVDNNGEYEIFANGHPKFLTKACRKKVMDASVHMAETFSCFEEGQSLSLAAAPASGLQERGDSRDVHITDQQLAEAMLQSGRGSRGRRRRVPPQSTGDRLLHACTRLPEPEEEFGCR
jgi:hypothetical protein